MGATSARPEYAIEWAIPFDTADFLRRRDVTYPDGDFPLEGGTPFNLNDASPLDD